MSYYLLLIVEEFIKAIIVLVVNCFPRLISYLPTEASARAELANLSDRATPIRVQLDEAEQNCRIESESVLHWFSEVRSIAFDAEDLNEEFEARARVAMNASYWAIFSWKWYYWHVLNRVAEIHNKYDAIYNDRQAQMLRECDLARVVSTTRRSDTHQTSSLEGSPRLLGRLDERRRLISLLLQPMNSRHFPTVVSIVGEGGIGKTALAQLAFNNTDITNHFDPLIWVRLSPNPDPVEIIKKIIEATRETNCNLSTLDMLQHCLRQLLSGKKFLLVLDGVYTEDPFVWDTVWFPLNAAHPRSKVLVTTRSLRTAQYMGSRNIVDLTSLNSTALWFILKGEAFPQVSTSDSVPDNFKNIGKKITAKCQGSPLTAKLLGKTLCGITDEDEWNRLLQDMPDPDPDAAVDNILPSLKLIYQLLPLHLKRCFAYCSIFPKGFEFDIDDLVKLWLSEGLLKSEQSRVGKALEDIGRKQFNDLLSRSFFQPCGRNRYVIPGAIHDLAQSVSVYECARVDQSGIKHGKLTMTRYASLCGDHLKPELVKHVYDRKHLRTLIVCTTGLVPVEYVLQQKLLSNLRFLRSLDLSNCKFDNLDKSIGNLIHLRYLNLHGSLFKTLPDSICKLINLQTLNLDKCYNLKRLPSGMSNLINMWHIGLSLNWEKWDGKDFDFMPPELGRLTSLQTLSRFVVARRNGCGITELKNLNLRGELCISKLENVNSNEAREARLYRKEHLEFLMLRWSSRNRFDSENEKEVLRHLYPSDAIKSIWIEGYNGSTFPPWVTDPTFRHLETLRLLNCKVCPNLPDAARLPQLRKLYLNRLDKVKDLNQLVCQSADSVGFLSLELLHLSDMPELEEWFAESNISLTKLSEISISNCPKLQEISYLPSSVSRFELRNCTAQMLLPSAVPSLSNLIVEGVDSNIIEWIQNLTSLTSLSLIKIPELKCITCENMSCLSSLTMLKIEGCKEFESIQSGDAEYLHSLKKLDISYCRRLQSLFNQGLPCQIEELYLKGLESLNSLPSGLDGLSDVHTLDICDVPKLSSLPMMPESLCFLSTKGCPDLQRWCDAGGRDRPDINRVRCLLIENTQ